MDLRIPLLNSLDFFVWGHLKSVFYKTPPHNIDKFTKRITVVRFSISDSLFQKDKEEFDDFIYVISFSPIISNFSYYSGVGTELHNLLSILTKKEARRLIKISFVEILKFVNHYSQRMLLLIPSLNFECDFSEITVYKITNKRIFGKIKHPFKNAVPIDPSSLLRLVRVTYTQLEDIKRILKVSSLKIKVNCIKYTLFVTFCKTHFLKWLNKI